MRPGWISCGRLRGRRTRCTARNVPDAAMRAPKLKLQPPLPHIHSLPSSCGAGRSPTGKRRDILWPQPARRIPGLLQVGRAADAAQVCWPFESPQSRQAQRAGASNSVTSADASGSAGNCGSIATSLRCVGWAWQALGVIAGRTGRLLPAQTGQADAEAERPSQAMRRTPAGRATTGGATGRDTGRTRQCAAHARQLHRRGVLAGAAEALPGRMRADLAPPRRLRGVHVTLRGAGGDVQRAAVAVAAVRPLPAHSPAGPSRPPGPCPAVRRRPGATLQRHIGLARMQQRHGAAAPQRFVGLAIQAVQPFMRRGRVHRPPGEVRAVARPAGFGARRRQQLPQLPEYSSGHCSAAESSTSSIASLAVPRILPDPPQRGGIRCIVHQVQRGVDEGRGFCPLSRKPSTSSPSAAGSSAAAPAPVTSGRCCSSSPGWHRLDFSGCHHGGAMRGA